MDEFEESLRRAGRTTLIDDADVRRELGELLEARAAGRRGRRLTLPVLIGSGALLLGGAGSVAAAAQFGPWNVTDPDYVVARDWYDVEGTYLGSCEAHVTIEHTSPEALAEAQRLIAGLDLGALEPDPTSVALSLSAVGRLDDFGRLIGGTVPDPSIAELLPAGAPPGFLAFQSDARILQIGLLMTVHEEISAGLHAAGLDPEFAFTGEGEVQCTTDPGPWPAWG